jgi:hypothetical protein
MMRLTVGVLAVVLAAGVARSQDQIVLQQVLGSWQGDDEVQFVELLMIADGQNGLAGVAQLEFDDATNSDDGRRFFVFQQNVAIGTTGSAVLVATNKLRDITAVQPDFTLPPGLLHPTDGRVCYEVAGTLGPVTIDCVAYGAFTGDNGTFGPPVQATPDDRSLLRSMRTGHNRTDWAAMLNPTPADNAGFEVTMTSLCGNGTIDQGEQCDGKALAGLTCQSPPFNFPKGKLQCTQCHFDVTKCSTCGNDAINGSEQCDGTDLGGNSCETLGFTGGSLACTSDCKLTTAGCDPTFYVPGGGGVKTDCLAEWLVTNAGGRPGGTGAAPPRERCKDGDPGCDADGVADGVCTFTIAPCLGRSDDRLTGCSPPALASWQLTGKIAATDPLAAALTASAATLGPSSVAGTTVTFSPALAASGCGPTVAVPVKAGTKLVLHSRATAAAGKPRDSDTLRLVCTH